MTVTRSIFHHFMLRILRIFMLRILRILSICLFKKVSSWKVKVKVRRMLQYMEPWHTITGLTNSISRKRETEIPPHMWESTGYYPVTLERRGLRPALVFPPRFVFVRFCIVSAPHHPSIGFKQLTMRSAPSFSSKFSNIIPAKFLSEMSINNLISMNNWHLV